MNTSDNQIQTYAKRLQKMIQCKVDVEGEWKYDGFSGQIAEGKIWDVVQWIPRHHFLQSF